jgi:iron(III)-enterobactin esterase
MTTKRARTSNGKGKQLGARSGRIWATDCGCWPTVKLLDTKELPVLCSLRVVVFCSMIAGVGPAIAQSAATPSTPAPVHAASATGNAAASAPAHAAPPTRDPHTSGYVTAKELPEGAIPAADVDGNFILAPTHTAAPEAAVQAGVPQGTVIEFTMSSADSKSYPGIAREAGTFGTPDPSNPARLLVTTSQAAPYTRRVAVYVPKQYVPGTAAPFIVGADGPDRLRCWIT